MYEWMEISKATLRDSLVLSCFMALTRIYSPIFGHIHQQFLRMLEARVPIHRCRYSLVPWVAARPTATYLPMYRLKSHEEGRVHAAQLVGWC